MAGAEGLYPAIQVRHASIERTKRCLIAYHHERTRRLRRLRWTSGSVLSTASRAPLGTAEIDWFHGCVSVVLRRISLRKKFLIDNINEKLTF